MNGHYEPGDHVLVQVSVTANRLIEGRIVVDNGPGGLESTQDIQVAAGATERADLVVPTRVWDQSGLGVELVDGDGDVIAEERVTLRVDPGVELVGVLPGVATRVAELPEQVTLATGEGRAEIVPLAVDTLRLGPGVLESFDTIVGVGDDLARLADADRAALLAWIDAGGRLLLDDDDVSAIPEQWRPTGASYAWAGRGEIRLVDGGATAGRWADIVEPSPMGATDSVNFGSELLGDPQLELATRAGVQLPTLSPLIIGLVAYALVVGPGAYLILRRMRRLTLAWVVVPLLAVVTAGGVVGAGGRYRSSGSPVAATFVESSPAGGTAYTSVLTFSRSGGAKSIATPAGWHVDESDVWGGRSPVERERSMGPDGSSQLELRLEAGQVAIESFSGPAPGAGLTTTARLNAEGDIEGTVTNNSDRRLADVAVFAGNGAKYLGALAPGAKIDWTLDAPSGVAAMFGRGSQVWGIDEMAMFGDAGAVAMPAPEGGVRIVAGGNGPAAGPGRAELAEIGIWGLTASRRELFPTGFARVAGWTAEIAPQVGVGDLDSTRTVLSSMTPIDPNGTPPNVATIRAAVVRSPFGPFGNGMGEHQTYRYLLPPGVDPGQLVLRPPAGQVFTGVEFWDGGAWSEVDVDVDDDEDEVAVPAAAVRDGVVLVRVPMSDVADPSLFPALDAREAP